MVHIPRPARAHGARRFLFLQGPHGHFFADLSRALGDAGHQVMAIGFNRGDEHYWADPQTYHAFRGQSAEWRSYLVKVLAAHDVTDIVLYGDTKPMHRLAKLEAEKNGVRIHCFEEGYLRPYWITYERGGNNGNSLLMTMPRRVYESAPTEAQPRGLSGQWGALWHHTWFGCQYHAQILFRNWQYPAYRSHRAISVRREWALHCKRLFLLPYRELKRRVMTRRLIRRGLPYSVFMLQLPHDASIIDHSAVDKWDDLIAQVIAGFAQGAPAHWLLVFKAHPLDDERVRFARLIARHARAFNVEDRVICLPPGKLGALLDHAHSALTVNSTAGQQALFRGLPLKVFGRAIYARPEFVADQDIVSFFRAPSGPDHAAYQKFRAFLLRTSQIQGDFYSATGRRQAIRNVIDALLADEGPYAVAQHASDHLATNPLVVSS